MIKIQAHRFRMAKRQFFVFIDNLIPKLKTNKSNLTSSIFFLKVIKCIPGMIPSSESTTVNYMKVLSKNVVASI